MIKRESMKSPLLVKEIRGRNGMTILLISEAKINRSQLNLHRTL